MKKIFISLLLLSAISCKKEEQTCEIGDNCIVKKNIFNKGVFQPEGTLKAKSVNAEYSNQWGVTYFNCIDSQGTTWYFPQEDLYKVK